MLAAYQPIREAFKQLVTDAAECLDEALDVALPEALRLVSAGSIGQAWKQLPGWAMRFHSHPAERCFFLPFSTLSGCGAGVPR